jgi:hypothetical protein
MVFFSLRFKEFLLRHQILCWLFYCFHYIWWMFMWLLNFKFLIILAYTYSSPPLLSRCSLQSGLYFYKSYNRKIMIRVLCYLELYILFCWFISSGWNSVLYYFIKGWQRIMMTRDFLVWKWFTFVRFEFVVSF